MGTSPLQRLLSRAAVLLLVPAIACLSPAEESDRKGRDSYLEAYVASHGSLPPPDASYASPSQTVPTYAAPAPAYGPPHRAYPHPPHHHLHHHAYGPPVVIAGGGGDYGPDNGNGGEMTGNGGGGGVDIATFLHALGKILVVKVIIKLVAVIIALLFLPKIKEKKKKKKPSHKPHRPQHQHEHDEDDSDKDEYEDDDDDDRRRRRALGGKVRGFGTSSGDPRLLDLAQWVLQSIETYATDNGNSVSEMSSTDRPADS